MKILMIVPQPFFMPRGTPFSVYFRTRTLAQMGHNIDLITYPLGREVTIDGVTIHRIASIPFIKKVKIGPSFPKLILDIPLFFKGFWMLLRNRYDYVHAHEEGIFFCLIYKMFFWRMKILYDMHSSLPQQLKNFGFSNNGLLIGFFRWLENLSLRTSNAVITICPELQKTVDDLHIKTPSLMIENTLFDRVELTDKGDDVVDDLINWERYAGKRIVLYTGTFEFYQGIPLLLESVGKVVSKIPNAIFILVGGTPTQLADMRRLAMKLKIKDHVIFTGNLTPNTVKCFIRRADVLVSPRIRGNNTPLKIYEYLASGKPIIATQHETHTQVLSSKEAVLTECDAASFAEGIIRVLEQPQESAAVGQKAVELYESAYSKNVYHQKLNRLLSHLSVQPSAVVPDALMVKGK